MTTELAELLDELREILDSRSQEGAAAARNRLSQALFHTTNFLEYSGLERSHCNKFMQLVNALDDLHTGTIAPLLQPVFVDHRPRDTTDVWLGQTQVAVAFELLRRAGHSRKSAIEFISRREQYLLHLLNKKTKNSGTTAANWHSQLQKGQASSSAVSDAFVNGINYVNRVISEGINIEEAN